MKEKKRSYGKSLTRERVLFFFFSLVCKGLIISGYFRGDVTIIA